MFACVASRTTRAGTTVLALALGSCSTLDYVHDPQSVALDRQHLSSLLKSIRCELTTFYAANDARKRWLDRQRDVYRRRHIPTIPIETVLRDPYFDLDPDVYGAFALQARVIDTTSLPNRSTSLANLLHSAGGKSQTLTISPDLSSEGTYEVNYNFAIQQDNKLTNAKRPKTQDVADDTRKDPTQCYRYVVNGDLDKLAAGGYPTLEQFQRIKVDGGLPLAAWLQDNTTMMGVSRNILADANPPTRKGKKQKRVPVPDRYLNEAVDGGQMSYRFTVQYTAGVDAQFSLISTVWSPLAVGASASRVQSGELSLYLNAYTAYTSLSAKSGAAVIAGRRPSQPEQVFVVNGYPPSYRKFPVLTAPAPRGAKVEGFRNGEAPPLPKVPQVGPNRGQMLFPTAPLTAAPGP